MSEPIILSGAPGSPYTRKMLAVLRYRHIPHRFLLMGSAALSSLPRPKVELLPTFYLPNAAGNLEAIVDSSPIIRRLENDHAHRSVIPTDPAMAFLDSLLEDYADEWLTKAMFHYRWAYPADIDKAGSILPLWRNGQMPEADWRSAKEMFADRQINRLYVVGSNPTTAPVIEASYHRVLAILEGHLAHHAFLMGGRPGASDFGVFGQLTQLTHFDPTPMAIALAEAPRVYAWVDAVEDLSGHAAPDDAWLTPDSLPATIRELLRELARTYVLVMLANARALKAGASTVETEIDGKPWTQQPFPYQAKCVAWLRQDYAALPETARRTVHDLLEDTGCLKLIAEPI